MTGVKEAMNEYREAIQKWLSDTTDLVVVFGERSDPQPDKPYISFKFLTGLIKVGSQDEFVAAVKAQTGPPAVAEKPAHVVHQRNITVSITAIGRYNDDPDKYDRASDILAQVQNSLGLPTTVQIFRAAGLALRQDDTISDISVLLDTETESRAVFDIIFGVALTTEDDPGFIDTVELEGNFDSDQDGVADDVTFNTTVTAT